MPTSVRSSQNCLAVFSKHPNLTFTRHSHPHRRESCCQADASCPFKGRGYAAAASRIKPNDSPPASSKSKPKLRSKAPAAGEAQRLSPSGLKAALRNNQLKRQEKEKESKQEELNSDPDAAAEYLAHITARQSGIDVWAMAIPETLDVQIPVRNKFPWGLNAMRYMMDNASNNIKNAISVYHLGLYSTFPPLYSVPEFPYNPGVRPPPSTAPAEIKLYNPSHLYQLMNISSTSPKAWLAGIPGLSLHLYTQMCRATAENDKTTLKRVTCGPQLDHTLKLLNQRDPQLNYTWKFVKENTPTRLVSIRVAKYYTAKQPPRPELDRMLTNALVRFDTTQSLEISTKRKPNEPRRTQVDISPSTKVSSDNVTQKRVLEYYVIEKKGWVATPWSIRERIYDTSGFLEKLGDDTEGGEMGRENNGHGVGGEMVSEPSGFLNYLKRRVGRR